MSNVSTLSILGEHAVYPGHALVVAYVIMHVFPDVDSALEDTKHGWSAAVGNGTVPGAGDGAYAGAAVIEMLRQGHTPEEAAEWAQEEWRRRVGPGSGNHERMFQPGVEQAERFIDKFVSKARTWCS